MNRDTFIQPPASAHLITHPSAYLKIDISYILDDPNHQATKQTSCYKRALANETKNQASSVSRRLSKYTLPRKKRKAQKGDLKTSENRVMSRLQSASLSSSEIPQVEVFTNNLRFFSAPFMFQLLLPITLSRHGRPTMKPLALVPIKTVRVRTQ